MGRGDVRRLRNFKGDRGVAGWSKIERAQANKANGSYASPKPPKPITHQQIPTSEIMSDEKDEMLSN